MRKNLNLKVRYEKQNLIIDSVLGKKVDYKTVDFLNSFCVYIDNKFTKDICNLGEKDFKLVYLLENTGLYSKIVSIKEDAYNYGILVTWVKGAANSTDLEIFNRIYNSTDPYFKNVKHTQEGSEVVDA
jgi:hypothetical protein